MNLFSLMADIGLDTSQYNQGVKVALSTGKNLAHGIGSALMTTEKVTAAAVGGAAAGIATVTGLAINSYADAEQAIGGVETLYKDSADIVKDYAANAYQTAGMGATEYMDIVTGFAGSLLQSLDGDTKAAAESANTALTDMSDNVNKMGGDIESLKFAYSGFSRDNFTMLDNLKLGYSGTREEMERLISDANRLREAQGESADLTIDSYADIIQAIHTVQTEMGITGTTAKEAATTISGSLSTTKSAYKNLLTGIADDNADFEDLVDDFVDSIGTAADNILPRVEQSIDGTLDLAESLAPKVMQIIPQAVTKYGPRLIQSGGEVVGLLVDGVRDNSDEIGDAAKDVFITGVETLVDLTPDIISVGADLFSALAEGIPTATVKIVQRIPEITTSIATGLWDAGGAVTMAIVDLFNPDTWNLLEFREGIQDAADDMVPFSDMITAAKTNLVDMSEIMSEKGNTLSDLDGMIAETEQAITAIIRDEYAAQDGYRQDDLTSIREYNSQIAELNQEKLGIYRSQQLSELRKIQLDIANMDEETAAQHIANAQALLNDSNQIVEDMYTQQITQVENYYGSIGQIGSDRYNLALEAAKQNHDDMIAENNRYYAEVVNAVGQGALEITEIDSQKYKDLAQGLDDFNAKMSDYRAAQDAAGINYMEREKIRLEYGTDMYQQQVDTYVDAMSQIDLETTNAFLSMQATTVAAGGYLTEENQATADAILDILGGVPPRLEDEGRDMLIAISAGMEDQIPGLENTSEMTAAEIADTIRDYLQSGELVDIGGYVVDGLITGLESKRSLLNTTVNSLTHGMSNAARQTLGINSPSTVFAEIGGYSAEGLEVGWEKQMQVTRSRIIRDLDFKDQQGAFAPAAIDYPGYTTTANAGGGLTVNFGTVFPAEMDELVSMIAAKMDDLAARRRAYFV